MTLHNPDPMVPGQELENEYLHYSAFAKHAGTGFGLGTIFT
jgi:hypothetical protein